MNYSVFFAVTLVAVSLTGCATQTSRDLELGPTFTNEQKELMTDEEQLAIYNAQVQDEDKLECEMVKLAGSRRPQKVCQTEKEREWNRESGQAALRDSRRFQNCLGREQGCAGVTASP